MMRFLADENFSRYIVRGIRLRNRTVDIISVQEAGLREMGDGELLEWAADKERIILTHDVNTMTAFGYERIAQGLTMAGLFAMSTRIHVGKPLRIFYFCPRAAMIVSGPVRFDAFTSNNGRI